MAGFSIRLTSLTLLILTGGCATHPSREASPPPPKLNRTLPVVPEPKVTPVVLVQPTSSAPDVADRLYGAKITARLANWLQECGIPITTITDDQVMRGQGPDAKVMILPSNPNPGFLELFALRRFVAKGGKLVVFYSAEPKLADLMGLRLGAFISAPGTDAWTAFRFIEGAPAGVPGRVEQYSHNIRPAYPARSDARIIAWWEAPSGRAPREPAWLHSKQGFWMSHILLESDVPAQKRLLASVLGSCDRSLWQATAAHSVNHAGTLDRYPSAAQAITAIGAKARDSGQSSQIQALLTQADFLQTELLQQYRRGEYPQVLGSAQRLDSILTEAFARTQTPRPGEFRGVWNHSGTGFIPGGWDETCQALASQGMTAVLPNVQRPWCAHYQSRLIPPSETMARYGDQLEDCLAAAHRHGMEAHAWVILWSLEGASDPLIASYRNAGRLQVSASGKSVSWLCPSHPDNRAFERVALRELAERYPKLDGIQLDYIRYKASDTCYCDGCRARFQKDTGIRISRWPAEVRSGARAGAYRQWRREQISRFVAEVKKDITKANPRLKLSASVYPGYPGCRDSIAQDWADWTKRGWVDFVCPMNYTADTATFIKWYRQQTAQPGVRGKLFAGIGVTSTECRLNAVETMEQINALRREGATGFTLFEANPTLKKDVLPYLGMGTTAR